MRYRPLHPHFDFANYIRSATMRTAAVYNFDFANYIRSATMRTAAVYNFDFANFAGQLF
jgi:hypothetical protein